MYWGFGERGGVFLRREDMADSSYVLIVLSCEGMFDLSPLDDLCVQR
jgi:hypothetical protein